MLESTMMNQSNLIQYYEKISEVINWKTNPVDRFSYEHLTTRGSPTWQSCELGVALVPLLAQTKSTSGKNMHEE
jgi:hypothetical protein